MYFSNLGQSFNLFVKCSRGLRGKKLFALLHIVSWIKSFHVRFPHRSLLVLITFRSLKKNFTELLLLLTTALLSHSIGWNLVNERNTLIIMNVMIMICSIRRCHTYAVNDVFVSSILHAYVEKEFN